MYELIKDIINSGNYELVDIKYKINKLWVSNDLTNEEMEELMSLAQDNAKPENSYAPLQKQANKAFEEIGLLKQAIKNLEERILAIEKGSPQKPVEPPVEEEYPPYVQPTGKHDAYNKGDKITYNGKKYECIKNNIVWNPDDYPKGWQLIEE